MSARYTVAAVVSCLAMTAAVVWVLGWSLRMW